MERYVFLNLSKKETAELIAVYGDVGSKEEAKPLTLKNPGID
jgi:hypothetical protein